MFLRVFLLIFFVTLTHTVIVDTFPTSYTATNHLFSDQNLELNGYTTVTISDSYFSNSLLDVSNSNTLNVYHNIFTGKFINATNQIIGYRIANQFYQNNTFNSLTSGYDTCIEMNCEIIYHNDLGTENIYLNQNRFVYSDTYPSRGFTTYGNQSTLGIVQIHDNQLYVSTSTDVYTFTGNISKCTPVTTALSEQLWAQNIDETLFKIEASTVTSLSIRNNAAHFNTLSTTKSKHTATNWMYDSLVYLRGINGDGGLITYTNNTIQMFINSIQTTDLDAPIRVQRLYTNMSMSGIITSHSLGSSLTRKYQYIASALIQQNAAPSGAYTHDVQMEQDVNDEFQGYNPCHYACRHNCTSCLFVDEIQHSLEFSEHTHGNCFQSQVFSKMIYATNQCGHSQLYITTPYRSNDALFFSSNNKEDGMLELLPRDPFGSVILVMNDTIISLPEYRHTLDYSRYITSGPDDGFYNTHKPFLIITKKYWSTSNISQVLGDGENAIMRTLKFTSIQFEVKNDDLCNFLFSTTIGNQDNYYDTSNALVSLEFHNSPIRGISQGGSFSVSGNFLRTSSSNLGWANVIPKGIQTLSFQNRSDYSYMGQLIDMSSYNITSLIIQDSEMNNVRDGLYSNSENYALTNILITNVNATDSYSGGISSRFLKLIGYSSTATLTIQDLSISRPSDSASDITIGTRSLEFGNWSNLTLGTITLDGKTGVGLYFYDLMQYPCNFFTFVSFKNTNPGLIGSVRDYMCSPEEIYCKDRTCYEDSSLIQPSCTVDKTIPSTDPLYLIKYFLSVQDAIYYCLSLSPKYIYITQNSYDEPALQIVNRNTVEEIFLIGQGSPILIGADGLIRGVAYSKFNVTMHNLRFVNSAGFTSNSTGIFNDNIFISTDNTRLFGLTMINCSFFAQRPFDPLPALPTDYTGWNSMLNSLLEINPSRVPYIRGPNTNLVLNIGLNGPSYLENVYFYGSQYSAYNEYKQPGITEPSVLLNVHGHNHYSNFISVVGFDITQNSSSCYTCGGLSTLYTAFSVYKYSFWTGKNLQLHDIYSVATTNVTSDSQFAKRFPFGDPYLSESNVNLGRLTMIWIKGGTGSQWIDWKHRNVTGHDYPWITRIDGVNDAILSLNDADGIILRDDDYKKPRQIQYMNDQLNAVTKMKGSRGDVIFGSPSVGDNSPTLSCTALCLPAPDSESCFVSTLYTSSVQLYNTLKEALETCPNRRIYLTDPITTEDISTNFVNEHREGYTVEVIGASPTHQIVGNHVFTQSCPSSTVVPTEIIWKDVVFKNPTNSTLSIMSLTAPSTPCPLSNMTFTNVKFIKNTLPLVWNNSRAFECISCSLSSIGFYDSTVSGNFETALYVEGADTQIYVSNTTHIFTSEKNAIKLVAVKGFELYGDVTCANNAATRCIEIFGSLTLETHLIQSNTILAGTLPLVATGVYWDVDQLLSPAQIDVLTQNWTSIVGVSSAYAIHIVSPGFEIYYPCDVLDTQYITALRDRNPRLYGLVRTVIFTGRTSTILTAILTGLVGTGCVASVDFGVTLQDVILAYVLYIGVGLLSIIVIGVSCCSWARCLCGKEQWWKSRNVDAIQRRQSEQERIRQKKLKGITTF